ncbi:MAG: VWA domain-containing protein [Deltaproteobacteria bacterium]|nr:VWA domain-containing protein [Deltaproteobacteria bacterium]
MNFSHAWVLHFLWLVPLTALFFIIGGRQRARAMERFAHAGLLDRLTVGRRGERGVTRHVLLLSALALMLFALAGPRWGSHYQEVAQKGIDIMIVVDVSPSMLVSDVKPDRLERARREISDLIQVLQGDRAGLVVFSGKAFTQCPLTLDYGGLSMFLNALGPDLIPVPGTDIGAAIDRAISSFDMGSETDKVILLITDGEDNEKRGVEAARQAAKRGIKIFVFGIGDPSGGPVPAEEGRGGFRKDKDGNLVMSRLNEEGLSQIASITGGRYVRSVAGDLDLDLLYFEGIRSSTEASTLKSGKIRVFEERFFIFVVMAFVCLLLEGLLGRVRLGAGRQRSAVGGQRSRVWKGLVVLLFLPVTGIVSGPRALASQDPDELYNQGRFAEAGKLYAHADMDNPKDLRFRYNRGCASYQEGDYKGAMAAFSSVLRRAKDREIRVKAAYNLGNTAFKQGDFASAAAYYRRVLQMDPESKDAAYNLELALRNMEKQKKEQEESRKGSGKDKKERPQQGKAGKEGKSSPPDEAEEKKGSQAPDQEGKEGKRGQGEDTPPEDLSGELRPREDQPRSEGEDQGRESRGAVSPMDRKKAEALLDNVEEDRSRYLKLQIPAGKERGPLSGKDW